MTSIVEINHVSKRYRIGSRKDRQPNLNEVLVGSLLTPFRRIRSLLNNQLPTYADKEFWALRNISFTIEDGETFGIVGVNGSGKSTLLKLIANIIQPTEGYVKTRGKVVSMLEAGTGFHMELTGRENAYINGTMLGMTLSEINEKFADILEFAGIEEDFIDTPVKRYSSGMKIRLGFSIAAHVNPDIMIVDEVFAVGDAAFREKCLQELEAMKDRGITVIVVSHSAGYINRLCDRVAWLDQGNLMEIGATDTVNQNYMETIFGVRKEKKEEPKQEKKMDPKKDEKTDTKQDDKIAKKESKKPQKPLVVPTGFAEVKPDPSKPMRLRRVSVLNLSGEVVDTVESAEAFRIRVEYDVNETVTDAHVICFIETLWGSLVLGIGDADIMPIRLGTRAIGHYSGQFEIPALLLGEGVYGISVSMGIPHVKVFDRNTQIAHFTVEDSKSIRSQWLPKRRPGLLGLELPWHYTQWPTSPEGNWFDSVWAVSEKEQLQTREDLEPRPSLAFRRHLSAQEASTLAEKLSAAFPAQITPAQVQSAAAVLRDLEEKMIGRVAGDVDDHVLAYFMRHFSAICIKQPGYHMEIGTLFGGSLLMTKSVLQSLNSEDSIVAIDPFSGYYGQQKDPRTGLPIVRDNVINSIKICGFSLDKIEVIEGYSEDPEIQRHVKDYPLKSLWIDGDHSYEGVKQDWDYYSKLVVPEGYVLIDNYNDLAWPAITAYIDQELLPNLTGWRVICEFGRSILFQKITL